MVFNCLALKYKNVFTEIFHFIYRRNLIAGPKIGYDLRKSSENIVWVRALVFILGKEYSLKLYKDGFSKESDKWCVNRGL
jgi:hypothetical protein